eukprot:5340557-Amphidinium_carterae.1
MPNGGTGLEIVPEPATAFDDHTSLREVLVYEHRSHCLYELFVKHCFTNGPSNQEAPPKNNKKCPDLLSCERLMAYSSESADGSTCVPISEKTRNRSDHQWT